MSVTGRIAQAPALKPFQYALTPVPNGLNHSETTDRDPSHRASVLAVMKCASVFERQEVLGEVLRLVHQDPEALLDGNRELDEVERVRADRALDTLRQGRLERHVGRPSAART